MRKRLVRVFAAVVVAGYVFWAYNASTGGLYVEPPTGGFVFQSNCQSVMAAAVAASSPTPAASPSPAPTPMMQYFGCYPMQ